MGLVGSTLLPDNMAAFEIQSTIRELIKKYNVWTDEEKCNNLELVYKNNLLKLSDSQLYEISLLIGHKYDKNIPKEKLCEIIVAHYKKRINLLKKISVVVNKCADMVIRVRSGEVCKGTTRYVDDFFTCSQIPKAMWVNKNDYMKLIDRMEKGGRIETVMLWIDKLNKQYYSSLHKLLEIVNIIKNDIDNTVSFTEFQIIERKTEELLKNTSEICEMYYLLAINSQ